MYGHSMPFEDNISYEASKNFDDDDDVVVKLLLEQK